MKIETKVSTQILLCILVFLLGIGLLVFSIKFTKDYDYKQSTYKDISGVVTWIDTKEENGTKTTDITVEYEVDGKVYHAHTTMSSYDDVYARGSTINFKYNPDDPLDVIWKHDASSKIVFPLVAIVLMIAGIFGTVKNIKTLITEGNHVVHEENNNFENTSNNQVVTSVENIYQPTDNINLINNQKEEVKPVEEPKLTTVEESKSTALEDIYKN